MDGRTAGRVGLAGAIAACMALTALAPSAAAAPPDEQASPGQAIVEVAASPIPAKVETGSPSWRRLRDRTGALLTKLVKANGLDVISRIPETGQLTVALGEGEDVADLRNRLANDPSVTGVDPDAPLELRLTPNDPGFNAVDPNAPGSDFRQWNLSRIAAPQAWDLSGGAGAEVAVVDTGVDVTHPDLSGRIAATLDCTGGCAGGNVADGDGHGTHVAGLACATTNNGYGIASAGFACNLVPVRINLTCSDIASAVTAAANRGSGVINMSVGGSCSSVVNELQYALGRGSVLVAAGDNETNPNPNQNYPAQWIQPVGTGSQLDFNRGLVVTSANHSGAVVGQQNSGVSVTAFGAAASPFSGGQQGILSTWIAAAGDCASCRTTVSGVNRYAYLVGTSMAAPQVAGVAALMRTVSTGLSAPDVARLIKQTASNCGSYTAGVGWGTVNAERAVIAAGKLDRDPPASKVKKASLRKLKLGSGDGAGSTCQVEIPASGVKSVYIYVARGKSDEYRLIGVTKKDRWRFKKRKNDDFDFVPKRGKRYRFFSVAVDEAGNSEASPPKADEKLGRKKGKRRRR